MLPIRSDTTAGGFPWVTISLILLCVAVYFGRSFLPELTGGLVPVDLLSTVFHPERGLETSLLVLLVAFFMHGGILHLVSNMWYLWIFGFGLESNIGPARFLSCYLVSGVFSMIVQVFSEPLSTIPIVGASGAIAGVMGAYLVLLPLSKIVFWFPPVFLFRLPAFIFLAIWFGLQYLSMRQPSGGSGIAWWAHIGGFACGIAAGFLLRRGAARKPPRRASASRRPAAQSRKTPR